MAASRSATTAEIRTALLVAAPLAAANLAQMAMQVTNAVMVGHLGAVSLAAAGLGNAFNATLLMTAQGLLTAVAPLAAHAIGAGDNPEAGRVAGGGMIVAAALAAPMIAILIVLPRLLSGLGYETNLVTEIGQLPSFDTALYNRARAELSKVAELRVPPRDAKAFEVAAGHFFRIVSVEGPQVGDLNLWNAHDLTERFYSGKTRALHATHLSTGDRLWSTFPRLRPMATITHDTLDWYGWDEDGAGVHDVIGTRCDPYTNLLLNGTEYHHCCHSNLTRALATERDLPLAEAEVHIHDVMNVFMCTGYMRDTHQYFMKASPVRPGDFIEFFAEINLLVGLSACPGGDCGASHSDDTAKCYSLKVEIHRPRERALAGWQSPPPNRYSRSHGTGEGAARVITRIQ